MGKSKEKWGKVANGGENWLIVGKSGDKLEKSGEKWLGVAICGFMWLKVVLCG